MINKCPFSKGTNIWPEIPTIQAKRLFEAREYSQPANTQYQQYANFAISFDEFSQRNCKSLLLEIDELYDNWISRYQYTVKIRAILYEKMMMTRYSTTLKTGISTFFLFLNWIFWEFPDISKEEVFQKILYFMWTIQRASLPNTNEVDIEWSYKSYIHKLLQSEIPEWYTKIHEEKLRQLPCPMVFTENWKKLLRDIIWIIYKHFPEHKK